MPGVETTSSKGNYSFDCCCYIFAFEIFISRWFNVTFSSLSWGSRFAFERVTFSPSQKGHKELLGYFIFIIFSLFFIFTPMNLWTTPTQAICGLHSLQYTISWTLPVRTRAGWEGPKDRKKWENRSNLDFGLLATSFYCWWKKSQTTTWEDSNIAAMILGKYLYIYI